MWIRLKNNAILNMDSIINISKCLSCMNEGTWEKINYNTNIDLNELLKEL